jgi:hypothetical protein
MWSAKRSVLWLLYLHFGIWNTNKTDYCFIYTSLLYKIVAKHSTVFLWRSWKNYFYEILWPFWNYALPNNISRQFRYYLIQWRQQFYLKLLFLLEWVLVLTCIKDFLQNVISDDRVQVFRNLFISVNNEN